MDGLCIRDLAHVTGGRLVLGSMPPLGGDLEPLGRIAVDLSDVTCGSVYWEQECRKYSIAEEAFARGAQGVVVTGRHIEPWAGRFSLSVDNSRHALWLVAREVRRRFPGQVVAVAGNSGRRATLRMLESILSSSSPCNSSCSWPGQDRSKQAPVGGLPLSELALIQELAQVELDPNVGHLLLEIRGESSAKIRQYSDLCEPSILVINSLANSKSADDATGGQLENSLQSFLEMLPAKGQTVLNVDDPLLGRVAAHCPERVLTIGRSPDAEFAASQVAWRDGWLSFTVEETEVRVPVWGRHYLSAAMAAFAVGRLLGMSAQQIASKLETMPDADSQFEILRTEEYAIVLDATLDRAGNPWDALRLLRDMDVTGRRVVAYGDDGSRELGYYRKLGIAAVAEFGADLLLVSGPQAPLVIAAARAAGMPPGRTQACQSYEEMKQAMNHMIESGDAILLQGQSRVELQQFVNRFRSTAGRLVA